MIKEALENGGVVEKGGVLFGLSVIIITVIMMDRI